MLMNRWQTTLRQPVSFSGKGLHSGRVVSLRISPAPANHGLVFSRSDTEHSRKILARADHISGTTLSTTLGEGSSSISTIEHLMAAFAGLGISNALVVVDAPEIPIMDGSALDFVGGLMKAGLTDLPNPALSYRLKRRLSMIDGDKRLILEPSSRQRIRCSIDFTNKVIGSQEIEYRESIESFLTIADARTFCHFSDVQAMREKGLALGGGLDNAVVVTENGILNDSGLRSADEFVRHKLLDLIGDFATLGAPLLADVHACRSGHSLHAKALQFLLKHKSLYLEEFYPEADALNFERAFQRLLPTLSAHYA